MSTNNTQNAPQQGDLCLQFPDEATARQIGENKQFVEVLIAPAITPEARALFAAKQNVRLLEVPLGDAANPLDFKRVGGGMLLQTPDMKNVGRAELRVVTRLAPTHLQAAWP